MAVVAGAAALAGCGGAPEADSETNVVQPNLAADLTNYQAEVIALPKRLQDGVMLRAIRDAKLTCQTVTELTRVEDRGGKLRWRVVCDNTEPYVVEITPDGTARIRSRR
ncbi:MULTISPECIES: hypothetical protein [unclassified Sphingomonas]|uniref:hypothetical protein n=1 Tax=unclassified Sphingomonas TaxID=196159 RepID=UPI0021519A80|nr:MULTISPECIES: hypothetical protein [unclassified Sphingomonas]MCR5872384.1 hypothetical protein [Sphingomonas sp. J344]UUX99326.1 hypothetical protein LRS08_18010 [Sphingomonas sp. J315]